MMYIELRKVYTNSTELTQAVYTGNGVYRMDKNRKGTKTVWYIMYH